MSKYALQLEYDGSDFHGWQIQENANTLQYNLEAALSSFADHPVKTVIAGRTDTGVHALNQVLHFESAAKRQLSGWVNGVNSSLPRTIRVKHVREVDDDFDARFSAISRTYHYYLLIESSNSAHLYRHVGWYHHPLDVALMQAAANLLIGRHDFSAFRASGCQANTPIREMYNIQVEQKGKIIRFSLTANAFLQHMVRNIIGAFIYVGNGRLDLAQFAAIFARADRTLSPPTFMPNGLYLTNIDYVSAIFPAYNDIWLYNA